MKLHFAKLTPLLPPSKSKPAALAAVALLLAGCAVTPEANRPTTRLQQSSLAPVEAYDRLKEGNARFVAGKTLARDWEVQRGATASGQYPFAVILSCIDSRASSEIVFDQGLGDLFNARIAGNVLNEDILGSMEFATRLAGSKVIAVIGHTACGAVKGACSDAELGHLTQLLDKIDPSVEAAGKSLPGLSKTDPQFVETVAELNVRNVMKQIREESGVIRELIDNGGLMVVGGIHDLETGKVRFFED